MSFIDYVHVITSVKSQGHLHNLQEPRKKRHNLFLNKLR